MNSVSPTPAADPKPWLQSYPPGMPAELGPLEFQSIPQMFSASVQRYRDQPAFESFGVQITYAELDRLTRDFAAYLQTRLGLRKGDRVAVMMPNILQYPVAVYGILRAGLVVVSVNPLYTPRELEHQLKDSGASGIVIFESAAHSLQEVIARTPVKHVIVASVGDQLGWVKGSLINFVFRRVKKMVKPWSIAGAVRFPAGPGRRRRRSHDDARAGGRRPRVPAIHGRHHRSVEGSDAAASPGSVQCRADPHVHREHSARGPGDRGLSTALLSHPGAGAELHDVRARRRPADPDRQPARHPQPGQDPGRKPLHVLRGRQHAVQRAHPQRGLRQGGFQQPAHGGRRRGAGADSRWPSAGRRSRGACCPRATG